MTDEPRKPKSGAGVRRQRSVRSIYQVHYGLPKRSAEDMAKPFLMPDHQLQAFGLQVAGHRSSADNKFTGLLQCNGTVLKPILKPSQRREVDFYERLQTTRDPDLLDLRAFVSKYYGCKKFSYRGHEQDYIILEDLTQRMLEQCVMDVKIGRRTWDPLATEDKIKREQSKYAACKQQFALCIPGYQLYKLSTGKLLKYGKELGKKLRGHMVSEAIRNYLNGIGAPLCRSLLLQFLSELWKIQQWARRQSAVRLYCASLLLVYDAARLRDCCGTTDKADASSRIYHAPCRSAPVSRRRHSLHGVGSSFSGQFSSKGPVYKKLSPVPLTSMKTQHKSFSTPPPLSSPWTEALDKLNANHSFEHNYEDKLSKIKINYRALLDQLSSDTPNPNPWGTVKIIDFAHAFFNEDEERGVDENFREGVDSLVEIFEGFLRETDSQVS